MLRRQKEVQAENELTFYTINKLHIEHTNDLENSREEELIHHQEEMNNNDEQIDRDEESDDEKRISNSTYPTGSNVVLLIENLVKLTTNYLNAIFRKFISLISFRSKQSPQTANTKQSSIESSSFEPNNSSTTTQPDNNSSLYQQEATLIQQDFALNSQEMNEKDLSSTVDASSKDKLKKIKQENKNEIKKLKGDLQSARQSELEYKDKLNKMQVSRNEFKFQCSKLQHDNTTLQSKLQSFLNAKQQDKSTINDLEKKLQDERKAKSQLEKQLNKYSKVVECGDACKQKRIEFEDCLNKLRDELRMRDVQILKLGEESLNNKQVLLAAIDKMQTRTQQLENSLREETKLKLELFSVLGETRRQLEMNQILLFQKSNEVEELNCKISELMAIMPTGHDPYSSSIFLPNFISASNNELSKQQSLSIDGGSSVLKNNIQQQSANLQQTDTNNLSNNSNISNKTTSSSVSKGSLSDWKNLNHSLSLESTSGDLTPKSTTTSDL